MTTVIEPIPAVSDLPATSLTAPDPATETGDGSGPERHPWWRRPGRPVWSVPARAAIFGMAALLYSWDLARVGMGNTFYAAAVKSGTESWKAFFFGSLDPGSFITVDKPPAALWVMELSGRIFGFSSWSMLLPEALAGLATVMVLYHLVRRWFGEPAAVFASLALALTPVAVVIFRYNDPDAFLTLLLVLAAWACWRAIETGKTVGLVLSAALVGLAFLTKTLDAFIVVPAIGVAYLWCGPPRLARRLGQLGWAALALLVSSGWWVAIVELWPKSARPYIGGSTDNSELNLIFGYNGFARIFGSGGGAGAAGGATSGGSSAFGGGEGLLRMFDSELGGQISWLLPVALAGLVAGLWLTRRHRRSDSQRAGFVLWGGTLLMYLAVYDYAKGIFHPYYTVVMAPAVAALAGAGAVALWRLGRQSLRWAWALPAAIVGTALWADTLLARTSGYDSWVGPTVVVTGVVSALVLFLCLARPGCRVGSPSRRDPWPLCRCWPGRRPIRSRPSARPRTASQRPGQPRAQVAWAPGAVPAVPAVKAVVRAAGPAAAVRRRERALVGFPAAAHVRVALRREHAPERECGRRRGRRIDRQHSSGALPRAAPGFRRLPGCGERLPDCRAVHPRKRQGRHRHGRLHGHGPHTDTERVRASGRNRQGALRLRLQWAGGGGGTPGAGGGTSPGGTAAGTVSTSTARGRTPQARRSLWRIRRHPRWRPDGEHHQRRRLLGREARDGRVVECLRRQLGRRNPVLRQQLGGPE